jgi:phosphatidylethanolamine-binding protein (PEBP) family uncharacterized protein
LKIWNRTLLGVVAPGATLLAVLLIAGCGGGSSSTSGKAASVATTANTQATTGTAAKPPSGKSQKQPTTTASKPTTQPTKVSPAKTSSQTSKALAALGKITLSSSAFKAGGAIPARYTCDGADVSPPLDWHGVPKGTAELFLLAIDLSGSSSDAIQWAVGGIPPSASGLSAGSLPAGAVAGLNSAGKAGWGGVCGAKGQVHHVAFLFYALKQKLNLKQGFNPIVARNALKGSTLGTGLTLGVYNRA